MKNIKITLVAITCFFSAVVFAQDNPESTGKEIDPTKPTNLYTQVNTNLEYTSGKNQNIYGARVNVQYAFNPDNLLLVELPLLNNDRTNKFGLGDTRVRYFNAVKRNITSKFIAIAPFVDISIPTGSFENGLGTSSWSLAGGVVAGFIISKKLSIFPGVNYVHLTKPSTDLIPEALKFSSNGFGMQFNASYIINKKTFLFVNPIPTFLSTNGNWKTFWAAEVNLNRIIVPNKFKMNLGWAPNFTNETNTFRFGATVFL